MKRQFESGSFIVQLVFLVACAALCTAGCVNSGRMLGANPETWASSINIGDHLSVTTTSGNEKDVHVTAVTKSGITDNQDFIPFSVIQSIRVLPSKSARSGVTLPLVILTIAVVALLVSLVESEIEEGFIQPAQ